MSMPFTQGPLAGTAFARNDQGALCCEGVPLAEIAKNHATPCFVYSARAIDDAFQAFAQAAQSAAADVLVCYALKANSSLAIIQRLAKLGAGFDIVSAGELSRVLAAGGDPAKVVFSGVGKKPDEILAALKAGVKCLNVESEAELDIISEIASAHGLSAPISLRVNPDIDAQTHPYISTGLKENKFGVTMTEALQVYVKASKLPGIQIEGMDCHIGSQITTIAPFLDSLDKVLALVDELRGHGIAIHHLDLGGGLGICYRDETPPKPAELLHALLSRVEAWAVKQGIPIPEVMFEFGRAIVGNAGVLITQVELLKPGEHKNFAVIDAAMNDLMRPSLYEAWHAVIPLQERKDTPALCWDLVGPVCESGDWMAKDRNLSLRRGDLLAILSAGAYAMSMSSNYNSRGRAAEILVTAEGQCHLIRRRETLVDQIMNEKIPAT